ncbi:MAG: InlB B-repeat-containing protein [Prevotella sp.]|nr:InlB B-repeat-containing protein [Prevotella sp.]
MISTSGVTTLTPINKVTVTLDAQGGSGGTTSVEATPNIAMPSITLPTPTKTGFAFDGWYSDAECNTLVGDAGSSYTPGSDVTLYARWKKLLSNSDLSLPRVRCMPEKSHQPLPSTAAP